MAKEDYSVNKQLGLRIYYLRKEINISQEELSFRADINKNYLSDLERGVRNPTLKVLNKIANGLKVTLSFLFQGIDEEVINKYGIN
ncbi:MAG: helix-turn-helix transcriptional regulator [Bacilli bacterium]